MSEPGRRESAPREGGRLEEKGGGGVAVKERKGIYLRTVYPLNPGIPHYLDFPQREG